MLAAIPADSIAFSVAVLAGVVAVIARWVYGLSQRLARLEAQLEERSPRPREGSPPAGT